MYSTPYIKKKENLGWKGILSLCAALSSDATVMEFKVTEFDAKRRFYWPP
jgi:hypothetical protein